MRETKKDKSEYHSEKQQRQEKSVALSLDKKSIVVLLNIGTNSVQCIYTHIPVYMHARSESMKVLELPIKGRRKNSLHMTPRRTRKKKGILKK